MTVVARDLLTTGDHEQIPEAMASVAMCGIPCTRPGPLVAVIL